MNKVIRFTTTQVSIEGIIFIYRKNEFIIPFKELNQEVQDLIVSEQFKALKSWDGVILMSSKGVMMPQSLAITPSKDNGLPIRLVDHVFTPIDRIPYQMGEKTIMVQRDGYVVYTAPSGQGKTYFAINNIEMLSNYFDYVLYVNLELNENDVYNRFIKYDILIPNNLYIKKYSSVELLKTWARSMKGRCAFIIDNIDNLVGGGQDPFGNQLDFVKELDDFCKFENHHALILTQLVKDNNTNIIDNKTGQISPMFTYNSLSGVKQIPYQARTVLMSAYSEILKTYVYKVLKLGSGEEL